ncbi:PucR family transcriptional regulator [Streptomyces sp. NPDC085929]|uniref:PucR family transcriptional regulator n=1 Tax=Streptomyces sp. NPDC085929 TaxID=3365739 RepID=UPI0037CD1AD0
MCELLNRIWARPRGEWTRVLRRELPALSAGMVEELREELPGFSALVDDLDEEVVRQRLEVALLTALGYREPAPQKQARPADPHPAPGPDCDLDSDPDPDLDSDSGPLREEDEDEDDHDYAAERDHPDEDEEVAEEEEYRGPPRLPDPGRRRQLAPLKVVPREGLGTPSERARRELFSALTSDMPMAEIALSELAAAADWPLPAEIRAIALATPGETQQLAAVLDDGLAGMVGGQPCLLVPSPDPETRASLEALLRGRFAAVGHPVAPRDTASSLRWALRLLSLTPNRPGLEARALFVDDHLSTLLLLQDEPLAHALAARWLRPLANLTPRQSERLEVTLLAWLEGGGAPEAAKALSVHPQTVRYRMRQLEKLFGPGLRDPRTRFELEMALRSRRLMAQVRRQNSRVSRKVRVATTDFRPLGVGRMARVNGL